jgi:hypothetical protein
VNQKDFQGGREMPENGTVDVVKGRFHSENRDNYASQTLKE